ncbi:MAG: hypothetical protein PUD80_03280 [Firmicutes bacterium]|nr:hypothetical protein [Bacillota bacterium]
MNTFSHYFISPEGGFLVISSLLGEMETFGRLFGKTAEKTAAGGFRRLAKVNPV